MKDKREVIIKLVKHAASLGQALQHPSPEVVLCHADIHPGNLLISSDNRLYIVDWDNPLLAPKEKDLAMIGGCATWSSPQAGALFYQGYGSQEVNLMALAYYRFERVVMDLAEFCKQLLLSDQGGDDREQSYQYFTSCFEPGHEIDLAIKTITGGG